jgi:hypothetical protein
MAIAQIPNKQRLVFGPPTDLLKVVRALQHSLKAPDGSGLLRRDVARQILTEVSSEMALTWSAPGGPGIAFGHSGSNMPVWRCTVIGYADLQFQEETSTRKGFEELSDKCGIAVMTNPQLERPFAGRS